MNSTEPTVSLEQLTADMLASVNKIEVLCFGCIGVAGHYLHSKTGVNWRNEQTPWGDRLDAFLLTSDYYNHNTAVTGLCSEHHLNGWTAISFWDRSGDSRPGSNTSFLCHAEITAAELLALAREQWPHVFSRPGFPELKLSQNSAT